MREVSLTLLILMGVSLAQSELRAQDATNKSYSEILENSNLYALDFDDIDTDDSRDLSIDELLAADQNNSSDLFYAIDTNDDGALDEREFESWLSVNMLDNSSRRK